MPRLARRQTTLRPRICLGRTVWPTLEVEGRVPGGTFRHQTFVADTNVPPWKTELARRRPRLVSTTFSVSGVVVSSTSAGVSLCFTEREKVVSLTCTLLSPPWTTKSSIGSTVPTLTTGSLRPTPHATSLSSGTLIRQRGCGRPRPRPASDGDRSLCTTTSDLTTLPFTSSFVGPMMTDSTSYCVSTCTPDSEVFTSPVSSCPSPSTLVSTKT